LKEIPLYYSFTICVQFVKSKTKYDKGLTNRKILQIWLAKKPIKELTITIIMINKCNQDYSIKE